MKRQRDALTTAGVSVALGRGTHLAQSTKEPRGRRLATILCDPKTAHFGEVERADGGLAEIAANLFRLRLVEQ